MVIDDNYPGGTGEIVKEISRANPRVEILSRREKKGLGSAYVSGF